jgi:hypothetical protein
MALVFQYGSNCSDSEINSKSRLCGDAQFVDIAETVEDFELAFDVQSTGRGCAASDIVRKPGSKVYGTKSLTVLKMNPSPHPEENRCRH